MSHHVPREGAGQVVLVGPPNVGKSTLAGGADQRPAGDRPVSVHDPGPAAGDHDVAGRAGPTGRPAADLAGILRGVGAERDPIGGCRSSGR